MDFKMIAGEIKPKVQVGIAKKVKGMNWSHRKSTTET